MRSISRTSRSRRSSDSLFECLDVSIIYRLYSIDRFNVEFNARHEIGTIPMAGKIDPFESYVMPVSGTNFVCYIAMISFLAEYRHKQGLKPFKPRVIYGASGGCLVAYLAMMSSFTERVEGWTFSSDMFIDRPTPITPRLLTFSLKGFFYHRTDLTDYIKEVFIPHKLQDVEIVTGYYETLDAHSSRSVIKIVSNVPLSRSVLASQGELIAPNTQIVHPPEGDLCELSTRKTYLDALMLLVIDILHKTTNIPFMMEPLGKSGCLDYGVVAPSPRVITNADSNRSVYFSPVDIDRVGVIKGADMIFHNYIMNDILSVRSRFEKSRLFDKQEPEESFTEVLSYITQLRTRYCLVIYSTATVDIPISHFTDEMVKESIKACKMKLRFLVLHD